MINRSEGACGNQRVPLGPLEIVVPLNGTVAATCHRATFDVSGCFENGAAQGESLSAGSLAYGVLTQAE